MVGRECYHCKHWVEEGEEHDCWTKTETALTQDLSGALPDAWERLRETAVSFGDQRIYASHKSVMFSRKSCYFFVRPKRKFLDSQLHNFWFARYLRPITKMMLLSLTVSLPISGSTRKFSGSRKMSYATSVTRIVTMVMSSSRSSPSPRADQRASSSSRPSAN
jgi:hypothetical protein